MSERVADMPAGWTLIKTALHQPKNIALMRKLRLRRVNVQKQVEQKHLETSATDVILDNPHVKKEPVPEPSAKIPEIAFVKCGRRTMNGAAVLGHVNHPIIEQAAFNAKRITGVMNKSCGTEMQELSTSFGITRSTINSLSTSGNTYLPSGVMWGWRTLQEAEPLNTNVDLTKPGFPEVDPVKVMIFMTDGANTLSQGGDEPHLHNGNNNAEADQRTRALCAGAKAEGIQIFTIGYRMQEAVGNAQSILIECATSESNYYDASDANALKRAFKDIAGELSLPRLSI